PHGRRAIDPNEYHMRSFPFALTHVKALVFGGTAPVDPASAFAGNKRPELLTSLAPSGAPSPAHAMHHPRSRVSSPDAEAWKSLGQLNCAPLMMLRDANGMFFEKHDPRHRLSDLPGELSNKVADH